MKLPQDQIEKAARPERKPVLSPELREVLHMLKSLEEELAPRQRQAG